MDDDDFPTLPEPGFLKYHWAQLPLLSPAQKAAIAAEKIEWRVDHLINRAKEINLLYTEFSVEYQGMSAHQTRFLALTGPTTDNQVRQVVYAKFVLASILEWTPDQHGYEVEKFLERGGPMFKKEAINELCPYWDGFFADFQEAVVSLEKIMEIPGYAYDSTLLDHISNLLQISEMKAGWVHSLLQTVRTSTATAGFKHPTIEHEIFRLWNKFCLNVGNGNCPLDVAVHFCEMERNNTMYLHRPLPVPLTEATQSRSWFPIDINGTPWIAHAQAIAQQPHHLIREKNLVGEYADEMHLWTLTKTTDVMVPHYRCSLTSPCCSRLHTHCPMRSMCKTFGPTDCVHVGAGLEYCEDGHCKLVDWAKYNLCEKYAGAPPVFPDRAMVEVDGIDPLVYHQLKASDEWLMERVQMVKTME